MTKLRVNIQFLALNHHPLREVSLRYLILGKQLIESQLRLIRDETADDMM